MKLNIVLFFTDQQRSDTLGCNGQTLNITPYLDCFAREDVVNFKNAFTPQPVCGPARAMLQTGLYPTQIGCYRNAISLPLGQKTLATYLKEVGYNVAYVGKWHLASDEHTNHYETEAVPVERRGGYDDYWMAADVLEFTSHGYGGYVYNQEGKQINFEGYRADCITDYVLDYINEYKKDEPFFLMVSHIEPHHQNDRNDYEGPIGSKEQFKDFIPPNDLEKGKGDWEQFYPDYLGCCNALDRNFGRIMSMLKQKGIYDNTMVIYASDHGCHFRTHQDEIVEGGYDDYKRNTFEGTIRVPLLIKGQGFNKGKQEEHLVSLIDLPKTILMAAGYKEENLEKIQERNLQQIEAVWEDAVYIQISESFVGRCLRTERYKYVIYAPDKDPWNEKGSSSYEEKYLFDLEADPLEKENLINREDYKNIKKQLKEMLLRYAKEAGEILDIRE